MISEAELATEAHGFFGNALQLLQESGIPFLVGGGLALRQYTGIIRDLKDLDLFCRAVDYPRILKFFSDQGFHTELTDVRWLAKVFKDNYYIDIIFNTVNNINHVDDIWFEHATAGEAYGVPVKFIPAEELLWCKIYVQNRERYDGADVNHIIVKYGIYLDWNRIWARMQQHWHLLLAQLIIFQFVYPTERDIVPRWLFDNLLDLAKGQFDMPLPVERVCLGPIIDQTQYRTDIMDSEFKVITIKTI